MKDARIFERQIISLRDLMVRLDLVMFQLDIEGLQEHYDSIDPDKQYQMEELVSLRAIYNRLLGHFGDYAHMKGMAYLPKTFFVLEALSERDDWNFTVIDWEKHGRKDIEYLVDGSITEEVGIGTVIRITETEWSPVEYPEPVKGYVLLGECQEIISAFEYDLKHIHVFELDEEEAAHYNDPSPFGTRVIAMFRGIEQDVLEASKCLALTRYTAAVFHTCRAAESGIQKLAGRLKVPLHKKNGTPKSWGPLVNEMMHKMEKRKTQASIDKYTITLRDMDRLSRTRNRADHARAKGTKLYDADDAKKIFEDTKRFMLSLTELLGG